MTSTSLRLLVSDVENRFLTMEYKLITKQKKLRLEPVDGLVVKKSFEFTNFKFYQLSTTKRRNKYKII